MIHLTKPSIILFVLIVCIFSNCSESPSAHEEENDNQAEKVIHFINHYPFLDENGNEVNTPHHRSTFNLALKTDTEGNIEIFTKSFGYTFVVDTYGEIISEYWRKSKLEDTLKQLQFTPENPEYFTSAFTTRYTSEEIYECNLENFDLDYIIQQITNKRVNGEASNLFIRNYYSQIRVRETMCVTNDLGEEYLILIIGEYDWYDEARDEYFSATDLWIQKSDNISNSFSVWGEPTRQGELYIGFTHQEGVYAGGNIITRLRNGGVFAVRTRKIDLTSNNDIIGYNRFDAVWVYTDGEGNLQWKKRITESFTPYLWPVITGTADISDGRLFVGLNSYQPPGWSEDDHFEYIYVMSGTGEIEQKLEPLDLHPRFVTQTDGEHRYIEHISEHPDGSILILMQVSDEESEMNGLTPGIYLLKLDPTNLNYNESNIFEF